MADGITFYALAQDGPTVAVTTTESSVLFLDYKVTSILYAVPGNKSSNGFTDTTTDGTTTTLGNSFSDAMTTTFTEGFSSGIPGAPMFSASQSFGVTNTTTDSSAFTDTFTDATGVATQTANTAPNAVNHNEDLFLIWLNPQLTVQLSGQTPTSYSIGLQPALSGPGTPSPDILEINAIVMEPNASGSTTVPPQFLDPQIVASPTGGAQTTYPGLAAICKNVNKTEYLDGSCSLADQCGCKPSDFAPILALDPLLNYAGTTSPLVADVSGATACQNPSNTDDCRYIPVPTQKGGSTPVSETLQGPESPGGSTTGNTFTQSDATTTTQTLGGSLAQSIGSSFKEGTNEFNLTVSNTITLTSSQSSGVTSGTANSETVTLNSSTYGCDAQISIYEDTVFHTFVFQQPSGNNSCP